MTTLRPAALLIGVPLVFSVLLWFHPMIGDWEGLRDVTTRFQIVHVGMVLALPLVALALHNLLGGLRGRAAAVARVALIPFVVFYVPYVAFEGLALGVLGQELNGAPGRPARRDRSRPDRRLRAQPHLRRAGPLLGHRHHRLARRHRLDGAGLPPRRRAGDAPGPARRVGADRRPRPTARPDRLCLLRRGGLDGAPGTARLGHATCGAGRRSRGVGRLSAGGGPCAARSRRAGACRSPTRTPSPSAGRVGAATGRSRSA